MTSRVTLSFPDGRTFVHPDGPLLGHYIVTEYAVGTVNFHYGSIWSPKYGEAPGPQHLGPHHVTIERDGHIAFEADLPGHWWNAEWNWRPNDFSQIRTPTEAVAQRLIFPYGSPPKNRIYRVRTQRCELMGSSNITTYMPTTGERPDIGLITDPAAEYTRGGNIEPMLEWVKAAGSCPLHYRDETTGKPIDLRKYPRANCYDLPGYMGDPYLLKGPYISNKDGTPNTSGYQEFGGGWTPQKAHFCEMAYVGYVATGDLACLRHVQYAANFLLLVDSTRSSTEFGPVQSGEYRGIAWGFRELFMARAATLDAVARGVLPTDLHDVQYWDDLIASSLGYWYQEIHSNADLQIFRTLYFGAPPWQVDYMLSVFAFGVLTGVKDIHEIYLWLLKNTIDRTDNKSGFPPGYGVPYYLPMEVVGQPGTYVKSWAEAFDNWILYEEAEAAKKAALGENWDWQLTRDEYAALKADPLNGGKLMRGYEYAMTTRAVLVMAEYIDKLGLSPVTATYPDLPQCLSIVESMVSGDLNPRQAVVRNLSEMVALPLLTDPVYDVVAPPSDPGTPAPQPVTKVDPVPAPPAGWLPEDIEGWHIVRIPDGVEEFYWNAPTTADEKTIIIGNGNAVQYWTYLNNVHGPYLRDDGGFETTEFHSNGDHVRWYGVSALIIGTAVTKLEPAKQFDTPIPDPQPTPNPVPEPTPEPQPVPDPTPVPEPDPAPLPRIDRSKVNKDIWARAAAGEIMIETYRNKDEAVIAPLSILGKYK